MNVAFSPLLQIWKNPSAVKSFSKSQISMMEKLLLELKEENSVYKSSMRKLAICSDEILDANVKLQNGITDRRNHLQLLTSKLSDRSIQFIKHDFLRETAKKRLTKYHKYFSQKTGGIARDRIGDEIDSLKIKVEKLKEQEELFKKEKEDKDIILQHLLSLGKLKIQLETMNAELNKEANRLLNTINFEELDLNPTIQNRISAIRIKMEKGEKVRLDLEKQNNKFDFLNGRVLKSYEFYSKLNDKLNRTIQIFNQLDKLFLENFDSKSDHNITPNASNISHFSSLLIDTDKPSEFKNLPNFHSDIPFASILDHERNQNKLNDNDEIAKKEAANQKNQKGKPIILRPEIAYALSMNKISNLSKNSKSSSSAVYVKNFKLNPIDNNNNNISTSTTSSKQSAEPLVQLPPFPIDEFDSLYNKSDASKNQKLRKSDLNNNAEYSENSYSSILRGRMFSTTERDDSASASVSDYQIKRPVINRKIKFGQISDNDEDEKSKNRGKMRYKKIPDLNETEKVDRSKELKSEIQHDDGSSDDENKVDERGQKATKSKQSKSFKKDAGNKDESDDDSEAQERNEKAGKSKQPQLTKSAIKNNDGSSDDENEVDENGQKATKSKQSKSFKKDAGNKDESEPQERNEKAGMSKQPQLTKSAIKNNDGSSDDENEVDERGQKATKSKQSKSKKDAGNKDESDDDSEAQERNEKAGKSKQPQLTKSAIKNDAGSSDDESESNENGQKATKDLKSNKKDPGNRNENEENGKDQKVTKSKQSKSKKDAGNKDEVQERNEKAGNSKQPQLAKSAIKKNAGSSDDESESNENGQKVTKDLKSNEKDAGNRNEKGQKATKNLKPGKKDAGNEDESDAEKEANESQVGRAGNQKKRKKRKGRRRRSHSSLRKHDSYLSSDFNKAKDETSSLISDSEKPNLADKLIRTNNNSKLSPHRSKSVANTKYKSKKKPPSNEAKSQDESVVIFMHSSSSDSSSANEDGKEKTLEKGRSQGRKNHSKSGNDEKNPKKHNNANQLDNDDNDDEYYSDDLDTEQMEKKNGSKNPSKRTKKSRKEAGNRNSNDNSDSYESENDEESQKSKKKKSRDKQSNSKVEDDQKQLKNPYSANKHRNKSRINGGNGNSSDIENDYISSGSDEEDKLKDDYLHEASSKNKQGSKTDKDKENGQPNKNKEQDASKSHSKSRLGKKADVNEKENPSQRKKSGNQNKEANDENENGSEYEYDGSGSDGDAQSISKPKRQKKRRRRRRNSSLKRNKDDKDQKKKADRENDDYDDNDESYEEEKDDGKSDTKGRKHNLQNKEAANENADENQKRNKNKSKGKSRRKSQPGGADVDGDEYDDNEIQSENEDETPKRRRSKCNKRRKSQIDAADDGNEIQNEDEDDQKQAGKSKDQAKKQRKGMKNEYSDDDESEGIQNQASKSKNSAKKQRKGRKNELSDNDENEDNQKQTSKPKTQAQKQSKGSQNEYSSSDDEENEDGQSQTGKSKSLAKKKNKGSKNELSDEENDSDAADGKDRSANQKRRKRDRSRSAKKNKSQLDGADDEYGNNDDDAQRRPNKSRNTSDANQARDPNGADSEYDDYDDINSVPKSKTKQNSSKRRGNGKEQSSDSNDEDDRLNPSKRNKSRDRSPSSHRRRKGQPQDEQNKNRRKVTTDIEGKSDNNSSNDEKMAVNSSSSSSAMKKRDRIFTHEVDEDEEYDEESSQSNSIHNNRQKGQLISPNGNGDDNVFASNYSPPKDTHAQKKRPKCNIFRPQINSRDSLRQPKARMSLDDKDDEITFSNSPVKPTFPQKKRQLEQEQESDSNVPLDQIMGQIRNKSTVKIQISDTSQDEEEKSRKNSENQNQTIPKRKKKHHHRSKENSNDNSMETVNDESNQNEPYLKNSGFYQTEATSNIFINKETIEIVDPFLNEVRPGPPPSKTKWAQDLLRSTITKQLKRTHLQIAISEAQYQLSKINNEIIDLEDDYMMLSFERRHKEHPNFRLVVPLMTMFIPPSASTKTNNRKRSSTVQTRLTNKMLADENNEITQNNVFLSKESINESEKMVCNARLPMLEKALEKILRKNDRMSATINQYEEKLGIVDDRNNNKSSKETRLRMRYERALNEAKNKYIDLDDRIEEGFKDLEETKIQISEQREIHQKLKERIEVERKAEKPNVPQMAKSLKGYKEIERWSNEKIRMMELEESYLDQRIAEKSETLIDQIEIRNTQFESEIKTKKNNFFASYNKFLKTEKIRMFNIPGLEYVNSARGRRFKRATSKNEIEWIEKKTRQLSSDIEIQKSKKRRIIDEVKVAADKLVLYKVNVPPNAFLDMSLYN
ncbi:hypothetical protein M9Y10_025679 [Tritrichomonas musculus]|uniref:Uncharacterized protein n=1 Tax=Tritrichomonas musculus TaxID=1915356 RepID=A0ABR2H9C2_9EUKA